MFCPWLILFKLWTNRANLSSSLCPLSNENQWVRGSFPLTSSCQLSVLPYIEENETEWSGATRGQGSGSKYVASYCTTVFLWRKYQHWLWFLFALKNINEAYLLPTYRDELATLPDGSELAPVHLKKNMKSEYRAKHSRAAITLLRKRGHLRRPLTKHRGYLVDLKSEFWKGEPGRERFLRLRLVRAHGLEHA